MINEPTSDDLNFLYPELGLAMECIQIEHELGDMLALQGSVTLIGKDARANLKLNDNYELRMTPTIPGYGGVNRWFMWQLATHARTGNTVLVKQIRCRVELGLANRDNSDNDVLFSCGIEAASLENVITKSLKAIQNYCDIRLVVLPRITGG